ncbi:DnaJ family domain-containing protein [Halomonas sp. NO4]|uniref:DnaJ family domain-containing protein n=1 Tax=Halomonas sp. NO4 TaxID=2484813 RepID=UPI0013D6A921|nr:DnaJ family domain-containing protein [Halomonas sp. NO4]
MTLVDRLAEAHIQKAIDSGELDDLPGHGKPLRLDDDSLVPEALRAGYRLLKNAGYLPPELELVREIREVESLIARLDHGEQRERACVRLDLLRSRLQVRGRDPSLLLERGEYRDRLLRRLDRED